MKLDGTKKGRTIINIRGLNTIVIINVYYLPL